MADFELPVLVLDAGTDTTKYGLSSSRHPNVIPSVVGKPKLIDVMSTNVSEYQVGENAITKRSILNVTSAVENGYIKDFDAMEKIWLHAFQDLGVDPEETPVVLSDTPLYSNSTREKMTSIMFETHNIPSLCIGTKRFFFVTLNYTY